MLHHLLSAVFYVAIYAAGRWLVGALPSLDVWSARTLACMGLPAWSVDIGGVLLTVPQMLLVGAGLAVFLSGRALTHGARPSLDPDSSHSDDADARITRASRTRRLRSGRLLMHVGIGLGLHSVYALAYGLCAVAVQLAAVRIEERRLATWFGDEFDEFRRRAPARLLPAWAWGTLAVVWLLALAGTPSLRP